MLRTLMPSTVASAIRVLRLGPDTMERLRRAPSAAGRVHSVFDGAVNVAWHDGRLLTVHGPGPLRAPFAMSLERLPAGSALSPGAPLRAAGGALSLGGSALAWGQAQIAETAMPEAPRERRPEVPAGLGDGAAEAARGLASARGRRARGRLAAGLAGRHPAAFVEGARLLVGLGEGLTPAGDDCLVGALAVAHRFAASWLRECPEIGASVCAATAGATTDVAREFVLHAVAGRFADAVVEVLTAESARAAGEAAARLRRLGATSGTDTLVGIHLAWEAVARGR